MIATQHSLVARLKERPCDSDWGKFYRLYEKPILAVAAAKGLSKADCQDVLQETMVRMCRHGFARYDSHPEIHTVLVRDCKRLRFRRAQAYRPGEVLMSCRSMIQRGFPSMKRKIRQITR